MGSSSFSENYFSAALDVLPHQICIIDEHGHIIWLNKAWTSFAYLNGAQENTVLVGTNYLQVCKNSTNSGNLDALEAYSGILAVIEGSKAVFNFEYPCHSPTEKRWFMMSAVALNTEGNKHIIITHYDITKRKIAELEIHRQAMTDSLTGIANRRYFEDFLEIQWQLTRKANQPISLILADIDNFKSFNDSYGHSRGDDCLRNVANTLLSLSTNSQCLAVRFGGEEFALVLGNTSNKAAMLIAEKFRKMVIDLQIPHEKSPFGVSTISVGVSTGFPGLQSSFSKEDLVLNADRNLYEAKKFGRNCVFGFSETVIKDTFCIAI